MALECRSAQRASPHVLLIAIGCAVTLLQAACGSGVTGGAGAELPAGACQGAVALEDGIRDSRSWNSIPASDPQPPSGDLRRFELAAREAGVCVRWTTAAPAPDGTELDFVAHGPAITEPSGATVSNGHGFIVELEDDGARVTYGLDSLGSDEPRVLEARVSRDGRTVSAFVPRAELDRPPANMPDRPPFPHRGFSFGARVVTPPDDEGAQVADSLPDEGDHAFIDGRLCPAPCAPQPSAP